MRLSEELGLYGSEMAADDFNDVLQELHKTMCPQWSAEQMLYHPTESVIFVRAVRARAGAGLPEEMILRRLNNIRKRGENE